MEAETDYTWQRFTIHEAWVPATTSPDMQTYQTSQWQRSIESSTHEGGCFLKKLHQELPER